MLCSARETQMCQCYTKRQHTLEKSVFSKPRNLSVSILLAFFGHQASLSNKMPRMRLRAANASPLEAHLCAHVPSGGNSVPPSSASPAAGTAALSRWTRSSVCTRHFPTERPAECSWLWNTFHSPKHWRAGSLQTQCEEFWNRDFFKVPFWLWLQEFKIIAVHCSDSPHPTSHPHPHKLCLQTVRESLKIPYLCLHTCV